MTTDQQQDEDEAGRDHPDHIGHHLASALDLVEDLGTGRRPLVGLPTGFQDFDHLTDGLQPGTLTVIASRPGAGRTTLAADFARATAITDGLPVFVWTLEETTVEYATRVVCVDALRTASTVDPYQFPHTYGMDPHPDPEMADDSPQLQRSANSRGGQIVRPAGATTSGRGAHWPSEEPLSVVPAQRGRRGAVRCSATGGTQQPLVAAVDGREDSPAASGEDPPVPYGRCAGDDCNRALLATSRTLCGACARQADELGETNTPPLHRWHTRSL